MEMLKDIWNDSVWSEVIAGVIVAIIIAAYSKGWLSRIGRAFKKDFVENFWTNVVVTGILVIFMVTTAYFQGRWPFNRGVPQETQETKVFIREKSAGELTQHLRNSPPLQRETIVKDSYVGKWVQWEGKVKYIGSYNVPDWKNGFLVVVETEGEGLRRSNVRFTPEWRGKIENLRVDDLITFTGMINTADDYDVDVIYASFEMLEPKK